MPMNCAAYSHPNLLMPPHNNNSKSALSRQMKRLRQKVDQVDLKILKLLQQRTKLSGKIGQAKRRHRAGIYVPERERQLLARMTRLSRGKLPSRAVMAIYREILSGSRAAQGQAAVGLFQSNASAILLPGRWHLGACDEFSPKKSWSELARGLGSGALALVLLTGEDLRQVIQEKKARRQFSEQFMVAGDFFSCADSKVDLNQRIFIVIPRDKEAPAEANRMLVLIECKSTVNAVKTLLNCMPRTSIHAEQVTIRGSSMRDGAGIALVRLAAAKPFDGAKMAGNLRVANKAGMTFSILGTYLSLEDYGG